MATALPVRIDVFANAKELTQLAVDAGRRHSALKALLEQFKSKKVKVDDLLPVGEWLGRLVDTRSKLNEFEHTVNMSDLPEAEKQFLLAQIDIILMPLRQSKDLTDALVSDLLKRISKQHQSAIEKLAVYRSDRSEKHWEKFIKASDRLTQWTQAIFPDKKKSSFIDRGQVTLTAEQKENVENLQQRARCLNALAHPCSNEGEILRILDRCIISRSPSGSTRSFLKEQHEKLPEEAKQLIDEKLSVASDRRFDDLQKYRTAYLHMVRTKWTAKEKYLADPTDRKRFCIFLHTYAEGPEDSVDPESWSHNELPYLVPLIDIISRLMEQTAKRSSSKIDRCLKRNVSLGPNGMASGSRALALFRQQPTQG